MENTKMIPKHMNNKKRPHRSHQEFCDFIEEKYPGKYKILSDFTKTYEHIRVQYLKCGHIGEPKASYLIQGAGCPQCNRGTKLSEDEFLNRFYQIAGLDYIVLDKYVNTKQNIQIKHISCGAIFTKNIGGIFSSKHCLCPKCYPLSAKCVIEGLNDVNTVNPEMVKLFKYPEEAKTVTPMTNKIITFKCSICGSEINKSVFHISEYGLVCPICNSKTSYGERFLASLLYELHIPFKPQFSPRWASGFRYDFQILENIIIEVDGGWHFSDNNLNGKSLNEQLLIDQKKQELAESHGYKVFRINYNYKGSSDRTQYLIDSIKKSGILSELKVDDNFDFTNVIKRASIPLVKQVADLWNSYPEKYSWFLVKELSLSDTTIRRLLKQAYIIGLIKESPEEIVKINLRMSSKVHGHPKSTKVLCNETGEVFDKILDADKKYHASISSYFKESNRLYSGTLPDGTRLTWTKVL